MVFAGGESNVDGAHSQALRPGTDRTIYGVADVAAQFLAALDLNEVVLVGNDSGGLVSQLVAVHHSERLGGLVLTSCDAFEHFPPPILAPVILAAKSRTLFRTAIQAMRLPITRKRAYGALAHDDVDHLARIWVRPALSDHAVAEDLRQLTVSLRTEVATGVAARLPEFEKPRSLRGLPTRCSFRSKTASDLPRLCRTLGSR